MSANSPGALAFLRSCDASAVASIWRTSQMESASWLWLYLYLDIILRWSTLISITHVCCAAYSVLARITTVRRSLCTRTPYPCNFSASAAMCGVGHDYFPPIKIFQTMLTNCCLVFMVSGLPPPPIVTGYDGVDLVLVNIFEVAAVRRPQDGVCDVVSGDLGHPLYDPFLDADCCEAEDIISVIFVMGIAVVSNVWLDGAVVGADDIGGSSWCREHVSLLDVDRWFVLVEHVTDVALSHFIMSDESSNNCHSRTRSIFVSSVFASLYA